MSTVKDRVRQLRERYTNSLTTEPRHVFELVEALNVSIEDLDSVVGTLLSSLADLEKRLDRLERRAGPSSHR